MKSKFIKKLKGKKIYCRLRKTIKKAGIDFILIIDNIPDELQHITFSFVERYMQEHDISSLLVVTTKEMSKYFCEGSGNKIIKKLDISKNQMSDLTRFLSGKITAMGDLIYQDVLVVSSMFPCDKEIDYLIKNNMFSKEHLVWHRLFHTQNVYASDDDLKG